MNSRNHDDPGHALAGEPKTAGAVPLKTQLRSNSARKLPFLAVCALVLSAALLSTVEAWATQPKLVVFVTIDQLRGDMPLRFRERFGVGGFRYLMDKGVIYTNAYYQHSTTFTAVGHATPSAPVE